MSFRSLLVSFDDTMDLALARANDAGVGMAVVTDDDGKVLGTITDGDIRRAALGGAGLTTTARDVIGEPVMVDPSLPDDEVRSLLERRHLPAAAVVEAGRLVGLRHLGEVGGASTPVTAVVLAGGRGQRLRPLTDKVPKPLLTVGRTTILERLLEQLWGAGIVEVHLAVNYKAEVFEERLGTGEGYGIDLHYLHERQELGTAGPLSLLDPVPAGPILVTMADQVTSLPFARMVDFHHQQGAAITVAAFLHEVPIPYGVLHLDGERVSAIVEKPTLSQRCNAGIFVIEPEIVALVPPDQMFGMPSLVEAALAKGWPVAAFPILERWIDVGSPEALEAALLSFATGEEV
jgi:dTDP-glucose pyrophosphorylase